MIKLLKRFFAYLTRSPVETYLANAYDMSDFEYRLSQVEKGLAPFQRNYALHYNDRWNL